MRFNDQTIAFNHEGESSVSFFVQGVILFHIAMEHAPFSSTIHDDSPAR